MPERDVLNEGLYLPNLEEYLHQHDLIYEKAARNLHERI